MRWAARGPGRYRTTETRHHQLQIQSNIFYCLLYLQISLWSRLSERARF